MKKLFFLSALVIFSGGVFLLQLLSPATPPGVHSVAAVVSESERGKAIEVMPDGGGKSSSPEALSLADTQATDEPATSIDPVPIYDALLDLNFDPDQSLLVDRNTRATLSALYETLGPDLTGAEWAALQELLGEALPGAAAGQLIGLIPDYFAYQQAELEFRHAVAEPGGRLAAVDYTTLTEMRRNYFDRHAADRLFAEEEAQLPYMTHAMAVARDENLSAEERAQKLAELQQAFNRAASRMDSPLAGKVLDERIRRLRARGASDAEIFAERSAVLGSAEAQRLAEADRAASAH